MGPAPSSSGRKIPVNLRRCKVCAQLDQKDCSITLPNMSIAQIPYVFDYKQFTSKGCFLAVSVHTGLLNGSFPRVKPKSCSIAKHKQPQPAPSGQSLVVKA